MQTHALPLLVFYLVLASFRFSNAINTIIVNQSGKGNFRTIQEAIDSVPSQNNDWIRIQINPGTYKEKVVIPGDKGFIFLDGSDYRQTTISWDDHAPDAPTATFSVSSENFVAKGITFINTFGRPPSTEPFAAAVAASIGGDKSSFYDCAFVGYQDTLLDYSRRHYYKSCYIEGAVDFIWGFGQSFFEDCTMNSTIGLQTQTQDTDRPGGYITAQGRQSSADPSGYVFEKGSIIGRGLTYLGRAYGPYSRVIYNGVKIDNIINSLGWHPWGQDPANLFYVEAGCVGDGAKTAGRVNWDRTDLNDSQLEPFSRKNFIDAEGWIEKQPYSQSVAK